MPQKSKTPGTCPRHLMSTVLESCYLTSNAEVPFTFHRGTDDKNITNRDELAKNPKKRPKISEVVKMLEDIRMMSKRYLLQQKLVFTEGFDPSFDINDMLRASAEVIGNGTFGKSY
ncbi:unnamed protein product [Fraxinus pennsylvanica]|uniref:Uncharacterized protein n=1 Tax=Fraxinus pennsylvanica TaxID=56036 RepID=A0AAD2DY88_9LAMI|nr:unnamed protein product [Fraxinus pennsylvanica]